MTELNFNGRVAIITGAGQGMGREHAKMLAARGARVVVNDVNAENANETVAEIVAADGIAVASTHDVVKQAADIVQTAIDAYGGVDIVVNNAGLINFGRLWEMDHDAWWRIFDVTLKGTVEVSRAAMPYLIASGSGRVINIASNAMCGTPLQTAYGAAKAAIWGFSNALALEAKEFGVQVTTLMPTALTARTEDIFPVAALNDAMRDHFPASAVSAFVTYLAHQDTDTYGGTFEIGGVSAGRAVFAGTQRVNAAAPTPEAWADAAPGLAHTGEIRLYRNMGDSVRDQLVHLAPELDEIMPREVEIADSVVASP